VSDAVIRHNQPRIRRPPYTDYVKYGITNTINCNICSGRNGKITEGGVVKI